MQEHDEGNNEQTMQFSVTGDEESGGFPMTIVGIFVAAVLAVGAAVFVLFRRGVLP